MDTHNLIKNNLDTIKYNQEYFEDELILINTKLKHILFLLLLLVSMNIIFFIYFIILLN